MNSAFAFQIVHWDTLTFHITPKQLLAAKKSAQEAFLKSVLSKEGKCWSDFYKYV